MPFPQLFSPSPLTLSTAVFNAPRKRILSFSRQTANTLPLAPIHTVRSLPPNHTSHPRFPILTLLFDHIPLSQTHLQNQNCKHILPSHPPHRRNQPIPTNTHLLPIPIIPQNARPLALTSHHIHNLHSSIHTSHHPHSIS